MNHYNKIWFLVETGGFIKSGNPRKINLSNPNQTTPPTPAAPIIRWQFSLSDDQLSETAKSLAHISSVLN